MMLSAAISAGLCIPLFTLFVQILGASLALIGIIVFGREGISTFGRIPLGGLSDHWGRKPVLLLGTASYTISPLAYSMISEPIWLLPFTILHGIGIASLWTTAFAVVSDMTRAGKRGQAVGLFSLVPGAGFSFGTVVGGFLSKGGQFMFPYQVAFVLGLIAFFLCLIGFQETRNRAKTSIDTTKDSEKALSMYIALLRIPVLLVAVIAGLAGSLTLNMTLTFFPLFAVDVGLTEEMIGLILVSQSFLGGTLMAPFIGKLADIMDPALLLLSTILLSIIVVAIIPLFGSFWIFILLFFLLGVVEGGIQIVPVVLIAESEQVPAKGLGVGFIQTANHMGRAISPLLFSLLAGTQNIAISFWASSFIAGILLLVMLIPVRRVRRMRHSSTNPHTAELIDNV